MVCVSLPVDLELLRHLHLLGKRPGNEAFVPASKVTELASVDAAHPAHALKRDLVRLVANVVHQHPANQNKVLPPAAVGAAQRRLLQVREMDAFSLVLDLTTIDGKNPCILSTKRRFHPVLSGSFQFIPPVLVAGFLAPPPPT